MLSAAYQVSALATDEQQAVDPKNELFARRLRQRLEAEAIRDSILAVSGQLDTTMFGPGTLDPAMKRRSIYFQIERSALPPMMTTFDAPDTLQSMGQRGSTTVAPQSLLLMNNEQVRAAAKSWAERLSSSGHPQREIIGEAYAQAVGREPSAMELESIELFLQRQSKPYEVSAHTELAWADFCQMLFGLNEFLYID